MIDKDGVLVHGSIILTSCSHKKHCCIGRRYYCSFCFEEENILTPIFKCGRCETNIKKIDKLDISNEQKLLLKAAIICKQKAIKIIVFHLQLIKFSMWYPPNNVLFYYITKPLKKL